jgi:hypothetical protein
MRVLLVNLKPFYQCRALWLISPLGVPLLLFFVSFGFQMRTIALGAKIGRGTYFMGMGLACGLGLALGLVVACVQMEVLSKPFSFCLPAHRAASRRLVLLFGLIVGPVIWLIWPAKDVSASLSPVYFSGVGVTAYFVGASAGFLFQNTVGVSMVGIILSLSLPSYGFLLDRYAPTGLAVTPASTTITAILGAMSGVAVWRWLGRTDLFRRRCGRPRLSLSESWSPAAREKHRLARASTKTRPVLPPNADGFLLRLSMRSAEGSVAKYVWGMLYAWLLPGAGGRWRLVWIGLWSLISGACAWCVPPIGIYLISASLLVGWPVPNLSLSSPLLISGGRRERFLKTLIVIVSLGAMMTVGVLLAFLAMDLLGVPNLTARAPIGRPEGYLIRVFLEPMNLRLVALLTALFPVGCLVEIALNGKSPWVNVPKVLYFFVAMLAVYTRPSLMAIPPTCVGVAFVLLWIVCIYGVHRIALRSDLGRR